MATVSTVTAEKLSDDDDDETAGRFDDQVVAEDWSNCDLWLLGCDTIETTWAEILMLKILMWNVKSVALNEMFK